LINPARKPLNVWRLLFVLKKGICWTSNVGFSADKYFLYSLTATPMNRLSKRRKEV